MPGLMCSLQFDTHEISMPDPVLLRLHQERTQPPCYECAIPRMPSMGHGVHGATWEAAMANALETTVLYFGEG